MVVTMEEEKHDQYSYLDQLKCDIVYVCMYVCMHVCIYVCTLGMQLPDSGDDAEDDKDGDDEDGVICVCKLAAEQSPITFPNGDDKLNNK